MIKHILLYGNSIFLSGLAAQLQSYTNLDVRQRAPHDSLLHPGNVGVVIVDFDDVKANDVLAMLRVRPDLKIVGVNVPAN